MAQLVSVVLAAGLGTRMKSSLPKVLHKLVGVPMIQHVVKTLQETGINDIIVVLGYRGELVEEELGGSCRVVYQQQQLGTGHALLQTMSELQNYKDADCLVVCGDTPLLRSETLLGLISAHQQQKAQATVLTAYLPNPMGYGRIIKGALGLEKIVEEKDASFEEKAVQEINTGTYCFSINTLQDKLTHLSTSNAQGEYYLTDIIKMVAEEKGKLETLLMEDHVEAMGINNRVQLAEAERLLRQRLLREYMLEGVTFIDPLNAYIESGVLIGQDTIIYPGVILEGQTKIGENCVIGPDTRITDSTISDNVGINYSNLQNVKVARGCNIGPYSFLRPGTELAENVKIGDFVEVKNTFVGKGAKIPHLSYVGDSSLGEEVNIGAGTITCNYDGVKKNKTVIGNRSFVGSNSNLVAPIIIGEDVYIAAGSTVNKDIPSGSLAVARSEQRNIDNWRQKKANERE
ncbi:MAG: bifunctional UDP-N-acetylglucosamine diphosphorylase/glucosamine-1-phosphate N-acetyltransferase GlmU [Firmicutes bacterium HGW-Firmicutes-12]|nr:MAG: bifunctional UDP-N-acetylglucosamine diphosphorylase/glucosamine-1-phosphate N-acetyltransferase GlmU [Firmicutes bacterium HGW-Firmicutes-12]